MIKIKFKQFSNIAMLKLDAGSYELLSAITIKGIRGLGGFSIQETIPYLLNTIGTENYVAYNFKTKEECISFKSKLELEIYRINGSEFGFNDIKNKEIKKIIKK